MRPPAAAPFLTARWIHLAMLNYEIDPSILEPLVPRGTELDAWSGRCFASMVGFRFLGTRLRGVTVPFHRDFEEVNLRFYVRRCVAGETRRGVVFVKEIVPRRAIAWVANLLYGEKYVALPMGHDDALDRGGRGLTYAWTFRGRRCRLGLAVEGDPYPPAEDSEEAFVTEHYWGYTRRRDGSTLEYRVEHPRWSVWKAVDPVLACDVPGLYGPRFEPFLSREPASCFVATGSEVVVRRGTAIPTGSNRG